ncbi:helix-turn-helix domain-containing protein [Lentzea sp. BCCO 10_0798]|uniref:Helix-turn-helix domain-containing protein n=1 Tax=Lentzea kristufekii TaxID=3095430 RepID=A0ABU4U673_9PSEU|nr:helix-turn-helix domain-containing protein [Lentzea sp. BCCO 10_0798]MDX8055501.1 helix-turn-helix domain-containing protein [Lentzea sp. BCCO 10_0798]
MPRGERPLGPEDTALLRFAGDLRRLRDQAGKPSYRELARRANYSPTALSDAAGGRKLPSLALTLAFVRACEADPASWTKRWRELAAEHTQPLHPNTPYPGGEPYTEADAKRFFGRECLVEQVVESVRATPVTVVFGASGSGRTSLLRAGLLPALDDAVVVTPGQDPVRDLAEALAEVFENTTASRLAEEIREDPEHLRLRIRQHRPGLVLLVDDFERALDADDFVAAVTRCPHVVLSVRADERRRWHDKGVGGAEITIEPMSADQVRRAITEPAAKIGATVETAVIARLVADAANQHALPLVQQALVETWRRKRGMTLSLAGFEESGGIEHVVAQSAESFFAGLGEAGQRAARQLFLRLVSVPRNGIAQRRNRLLDVDARLLGLLVKARLVTLTEDGVELTHDAVLRWPRLARWIDEERENLRTHQQLVTAIELWEASDRDPLALYRGVRLRKAKELGEFLTVQERRFVDMSTRRETRRSTALIAVMAVLIALVPGTVVYALSNERKLTEMSDRALGGKALSQSEALLEQRRPYADKYALVGYEVSPSAEAEKVLRLANAVASGIPFTGTPKDDADVVVAPRGEMAAVTDEDGTDRMWGIDDGKASPGKKFADRHRVVKLAERRAVTRDFVGQEHLWAVNDANDITYLTALPSRFRTLDLSPDGSRLVGKVGSSVEVGLPTPDESEYAELYDLSDPRNPRKLPMPVSNPGTVALSQDGRELATGVWDSVTGTTTIEFWSIGGTVESAGPPISQHAYARSITYSGDGRWLAVEHSAPESIVEVWQRVPSGTPVLRARLDTALRAGARVTFSDDGRVAVVRDNVFEVHQLYTSDRPADRLVYVVGHGNSTRAVYRPQNRDFLVRSGGQDPELLPYDLDTGRIIKRMCEKDGARLTDSEWVKSFGEVARVEVC